MLNTEYLVVLVTAGDVEAGKALGLGLVEEQLAPASRSYHSG